MTWIQAPGQEGDWFHLSGDQFRKHGDLERKRIAPKPTGLWLCLSKTMVLPPLLEMSELRFCWWPHIVDQPNVCRVARRSGSLEAEWWQTEVRTNFVLTFRHHRMPSLRNHVDRYDHLLLKSLVGLRCFHQS